MTIMSDICKVGNMTKDGKVQILFHSTQGEEFIPTKRDEDACEDIYATYPEGVEIVIVRPHETKMFKTGLYSVIPETHYVSLAERGSTGTRSIGQRSGVIDSGYRGEWGVPVTNHSEKYLVIAKEYISDEGIISAIKDDIKTYSQKMQLRSALALEYLENEGFIRYSMDSAICQMELLPSIPREIVYATKEEILSVPSKRGEGKLGSTSK